MSKFKIFWPKNVNEPYRTNWYSSLFTNRINCETQKQKKKSFKSFAASY